MTSHERDAAEAVLIEAVIKLAKQGLSEADLWRIIGDGSFLYSSAQAHINAGIQPSANSIHYLNNIVHPTTEGLLRAIEDDGYLKNASWKRTSLESLPINVRERLREGLRGSTLWECLLNDKQFFAVRMPGDADPIYGLTNGYQDIQEALQEKGLSL